MDQHVSSQVRVLYKSFSTIRVAVSLCLCVLVVFVSPQLVLGKRFVITLVTRMRSVSCVIVDMPLKLYHVLILIITMGTFRLSSFMNNSDVMFHPADSFKL